MWLITLVFMAISPCQYEDSFANCYWDGGSNGLGTRFVSIQPYPEEAPAFVRIFEVPDDRS